MTPTEYREALEQLGLSIVGAGPVIGVDRRTSQRYAAEGAPETVAILLRLMLERREAATKNAGRRC